MADITQTLQEREKTYGSFIGQATICQALKAELQNSANWETMPPDMREALKMIVHKIARIVNGDPNHRDSWHDISGYAKLVADTLPH